MVTPDPITPIDQHTRLRWELERDVQRAQSLLILHNARVTEDTSRPGQTYTNRELEGLTVKSREAWPDHNSYSITGSTGWTCGVSKEVYDLLPEGKEYVFESRGFSLICGFFIDGHWYSHKSDQDFEDENREFRERMDREHQERLDASAADWQQRENALPGWIKERIAVFHEKGGEHFKREGWGYELVVCELAALYSEAGFNDDNSFVETDAIDDLAKSEGTSGNQHEFAKMLARAYLQEPERSLAGTVSALSPLTGDAYYEGKS